MVGMHGDRESLFHPLLTQCVNRAWSVILQAILHRMPVRSDLLLCDRWRTSAQAHTCYMSFHVKDMYSVELCFMLSSLLGPMLFADLLSLHPVTFLML